MNVLVIGILRDLGRNKKYWRRRATKHPYILLIITHHLSVPKIGMILNLCHKCPFFNLRGGTTWIPPLNSVTAEHYSDSSERWERASRAVTAVCKMQHTTCQLASWAPLPGCVSICGPACKWHDRLGHSTEANQWMPARQLSTDRNVHEWVCCLSLGGFPPIPHRGDEGLDFQRRHQWFIKSPLNSLSTQAAQCW